MTELLELLVSPLRHLSLAYDADEQTLTEETSDRAQRFHVVDRVPVLLSKQETTNQTNDSKLRGFNYIEHYEVDAAEFDYFGEYEDQATRDENKRLHEAILREVPSEARLILDVGCGGGWVAKSLLPLNRTVVSFDIALNNCVKALTRHPSPRHFAVNGDVLALPFKQNTFDVIISAEVIEHVVDTNAYIDNLLRVVKPGGKVIISTPYNESIQHSLCIHCNHMTPHNAHIHSFNERSLDSILANHEGVVLKTRALSNKVLLFLRGYKLLRHLPHSAWSIVDNAANRIIKKPFRLIYTITKE